MKKIVGVVVVLSLTILSSLLFTTAREIVRKPILVSRLSEDEKSEEGNAKQNSLDRESAPEERFSTYARLSAKALLSDREWRLFREQLSNPELIAEAKEELLTPPAEDLVAPGFPDLDQERERLHRVRYLAQAMGWAGNPSRGLAIAAASEVIKRDVTAVDAPLLLKKSIAGDQIELYRALAIADPNTASEIRAQVRGTHEQRLIDFAVGNPMKRM
jgi:hypothetical protein